MGWDLAVVEKAQGLMAYGADFPDLPERWGDLVDQLFRGVKVADIPIAQPTKFILAINLKTAKALGLQIPAALIAQAR